MNHETNPDPKDKVSKPTNTPDKEDITAENSNIPDVQGERPAPTAQEENKKVDEKANISPDEAHADITGKHVDDYHKDSTSARSQLN